MLDHVSIAVGEMARASAFYDAVMAALGVPCVWRRADAIGYGLRNGAADDAHSYLTIRAGATPATETRNHWCFRARDRGAVRAFHLAGLAHGGRDDGAPDLRPQYHASYYPAFLLDPDGNRIEAVCHKQDGPA